MLFLLVEFVHVQLKFLRRWSLAFIFVAFNEFFIDLNKLGVVEGPIVSSERKTLRNDIFGGKERMLLNFLKSRSIFRIRLQ